MRVPGTRVEKVLIVSRESKNAPFDIIKFIEIVFFVKFDLVNDPTSTFKYQKSSI